MGDKERYYWHKKWRWSDDKARAIHDSGLQFEQTDGLWQYIENTYAEFAQSETERGVPETMSLPETSTTSCSGRG